MIGVNMINVFYHALQTHENCLAYCLGKTKLNDCIRNTTAVCNPRQNPVRQIQSKTKFSLSEKNFVGKKNSQIFSVMEFCLGLNFVSDFQCTFF